jgi:hypothetical protein
VIGGFPWGENAIADQASPHASDDYENLSYRFDLHFVHRAPPAALDCSGTEGLLCRASTRAPPSRLAFSPVMEQQTLAVCDPRLPHEWRCLTLHEFVQQIDLKFRGVLTVVVGIGERDGCLDEFDLLKLLLVADQGIPHDANLIEHFH